MSAEASPNAIVAGDILSRAARAVRELPALGKGQGVDLEYKPWDPDQPIRIQVFGCEPADLEAHRAYFVGSVPHYDVDELLRWLDADLDGIPCTFYRR